MTKLLTVGVVIAVTGALIIYDIVIVIEPTGGDTISEVVGLGWAWRHPVIAWMWGGLGGHLFWHTRSQVVYEWWRLGTLILVTTALLVLGVTAILPQVNPGLLLVLGVPAGRLGWPQYKRGG